MSTRITLVTTQVLPKLDFCNAILVSSSEKEIKPLQRTMNSAVRFIFKLRRRDHIRPYLFKLHFLPIRQRIDFKVSLLAFKIKHKIAPDYLQELYEDYQPTTDITMRLGIGRDISMFKYWDRSVNSKLFFCKLITNWNSLPFEIRTSETLSIFKTKLKTYYFKIAFSDFL